MQKASLHTDRRGFSLVEAILTVSLFGFLVVALAGGYVAGRSTTSGSALRGRAVFLAEEALEAARSLRNQSFSNLTSGTYGLTLMNGTWQLSNTPETLGTFRRRLTITSLDADRRQVEAIVSWQERPGYERSVTLTSELTNWRAVVRRRP